MTSSRGVITQLSLVQRHTPQPAATSAPRRLFDRWLWMFNKNPLRTAYSPARRKLLDGWLTVYDEDTLALAIDGAAADGWVAEHAGTFTSIEWLLADEARIERFVEAGERLRADEMAARNAAAVAAAVQTPALDEAAARLERERLREWAARRAGRVL